jgi:hypothetical protein
MATRPELDERARFTRWPGYLTLILGVVVGPIATLSNEELIYVTDAWACGTRMQGAMHVVPIVCLLVTIGAGALAWMDWVRLGRGLEESEATVDARSRFLALTGMAVSAISALIILAQWLAIFVFSPCMRA